MGSIIIFRAHTEMSFYYAVELCMLWDIQRFTLGYLNWAHYPVNYITLRLNQNVYDYVEIRVISTIQIDW